MNFLIGFLAGLFGGLVGLGGGIIMIPLMVGILKLDQHKAHGTSLVTLVFTGISGAVAYGLKGSVNVLAAFLLAATAMTTARAGARYAHALPAWKLRRSFGGFLLVISVFLLSKPYLPHVRGMETGWPNILVLLLAGMFTGFLSGMMGVGGGSIMVPAMVLLAGFEQHVAQGSSLLAMVPAGAVGAYTHWKLGNVSTTILTGLIAGILVGTYLGGTLAHFLSEATLRILFGAVLIWTGLRFLRTGKPST
jgi:uncharacterized membrane protein YfcA